MRSREYWVRKWKIREQKRKERSNPKFSSGLIDMNPNRRLKSKQKRREGKWVWTLLFFSSVCLLSSFPSRSDGHKINNIMSRFSHTSKSIFLWIWTGLSRLRNEHDSWNNSAYFSFYVLILVVISLFGMKSASHSTIFNSHWHIQNVSRVENAEWTPFYNCGRRWQKIKSTCSCVPMRRRMTERKELTDRRRKNGGDTMSTTRPHAPHHSIYTHTQRVYVIQKQRHFRRPFNILSARFTFVPNSHIQPFHFISYFFLAPYKIK